MEDNTIRELNIVADSVNLDEVAAFVEEFLESHDCSMELMVTIAIAVEEVFVNIAHYAYGTEGGGKATVRLEFDEDKRQARFIFIDSGEEFDPLAKPDPDLDAYHKERRVGGLGILMVKKSMDDVVYERKDDKNILTLIKTI